MKIFRLANQQSIVTVLSIQGMIAELPNIKQAQLNVVSIRDSESGRAENYQAMYDMIDAAGLENLYIATFDDLELPFENQKGLVFPQPEHVKGVLQWAKHKWEENGKPFVVHCTGGVSRSPAIAMLINQMLVNDYKVGFDPSLHSPNYKVLEFGADYLGVPPFHDTVKQEIKQLDKKKLENDDNIL